MFSIAARVSVLNGDPDGIVDLCEALTEIGLELRDPAAGVSTAVLSLALERASLQADLEKIQSPWLHSRNVRSSGRARPSANQANQVRVDAEASLGGSESYPSVQVGTKPQI